MIDREIMAKLKLKKTQYYIYRAKLYRESGHLFERTSEDELIFHKDLLHERLTRLFRRAELDLTNYKPIEDGIPNKDRAATYLAAQNIAINIFKLNHEGLRVLNSDGLNANRYLRRVGGTPQPAGQVHVLPGYTEKGTGTPEDIRKEASISNTNKIPNESEVY